MRCSSDGTGYLGRFLTRRLLVVALVALAFPAAASAHAVLLRTVPADRAVSPTPPRQVLVVFDDPVHVGPGNAVVRDGGGSVLTGAPSTHGKTLVLPLRPGLPDGDYSVRWSVISDDGHLEQGVLAFGVGSGPPPTSTLSARTGVGVMTVLLRWLFLSALLITAGLALFDLLIWRPVPREWFAAGGAVVALAAAVLVYRSGAGLSTRFGLAVSAAAAAAALVALAAAVARVPRRVVTLAALALLPVPTLAGHSLDAGRSWIDPPIDFLHVAAAAFWLGSLVALALVARVEAARRFSRVAIAVVLLIAATGAGQALVELRSFSQLWTTGYGNAILVKSGLFAALIALGWVSRSHLARVRAPASAEIVVLLGVVAAVGVLTALPPGRAVRALAAPLREGGAGIAQLPAPDAAVLAQRDGNLAAAVAVRASGEAMATFVGTDDRAVDVGAVTIDGRPATSCGIGCYSGTATGGALVTVAHGRSTLRFDFGAPRAAARLIARLTNAYRHARSVVYDQRIATSLAPPVQTRWVEVAPDAFSYAIEGGAQAVVVGTRRWDRTPGGPWKRSTTVRTVGPMPLWTYGPIANAYVLHQGPQTFVASFLGANRSYPAWFTVVVDRRTLHVVTLQMTAAAHFMHVRYVSWNKAVEVRPPTG